MFNTNFKRYLIKLCLLTIITVLLCILFDTFADESYVSKAIYFFPPFFFLISLAGRLVFEYLNYKNSKWLSHSVLGIRVAKFIIYIAVVLLYAFNAREDAANFILTFFVFYLVFTYFDVRTMYSFLKK